MESARSTSGGKAAKQGEHLRPALAIVKDRGELEARREIEHPFQDLDLLVPRREVVMEIEPDLPDGNDPGAPRQLLEGCPVPSRIKVLRLVRMNTHGRKNSLVILRQCDRRGGILQCRSGYQKPSDSSRSRALE